MKNAIKKIMAFVLVIAMIAGVLPSVFAASEYVEPFKDVKTTDWFAPYVTYVYEHDPQLMNGVTKDTFAPNGTCTRAMAAVVLYRLADPVIPSVKPSTFTDLKQDWYKNGIAWAQQNGVVNGVTETTFVPDGLVLREQLVTMLWRYAGEPKVAEDYLKSFPDREKVSYYAREAFNWAISLEIIGGANGMLNPQGNATRAEFAKILSVFAQKTAPCQHKWDEGKVTKEATCTATGVMTYTCTLCGETKTEVIPMIAHNYVDGVCSVCGAQEPDPGPGPGPGPEPTPGNEYVLASEIKDGDEVIIYNPGHGKAIKNENDNNWYLIAQEITPADSKITTDDTTIVWTANKNDDGTFTFTNGENAITAWLSENDKGTFVELTNDANYTGGDTKWNVTTCNAATNTFFISSSSIATSYGPGHIECYAKSGVDKIAGFGKANPTETDFGFQFYVKGGTAPDPGPGPEPTPGNEYVLTSELKEGDEVVIVCAAKNVALGNTYSGYYNNAIAVTPENGKIVDPSADVVWTVGKEGEFYTFSFNGQKIAMGTGFTSMPLGEVNYKWQLQNAATEGAFYLANLDREAGKEYRMQYQEDRGTWSAYHTIAEGAEGAFALNFYVKGGTAPDPGPGPEPTPGNEYVLTSELKEGDEVVIVCAAKNVALGNTYSGYYNNAIAVTPENGKIVDPSADVVWTVGKEGEFYTFSFNGQKIAMGTGFTSMPLGEVNYKWQLQNAATEGAFYLANLDREAGKEYRMQYQEDRGTWSAYHTIAEGAEGAFALNFYVKGATNPDPGPGPEPEPSGEATIIFAPNDVWGDGTGYQLLLDKDADAYGTVYDEDNGFINADEETGVVPAADYAQFEYKLPENADGDPDTANVLVGKTATVKVSAGTYDFVVTNPSPAFEYTDEETDEIVEIPGCIYYVENGIVDDYKFEAGKTYTISVVQNPDFDETDENSPYDIVKISVDGATPEPTPGNEYVLTSELKEGDEVVIVCAAKNVALGNTYSGYYNNAIAVTPENGKIVDPSADVVWTVGKEGEFYTFSFNGQKIAMGTGFTSMPLGEVNYKWQLQNAATEGAFYLANLDREAGKEYRMQYQEDRGTWSAYHTIAEGSEGAFALNFYVKGGEAACAHEWDEGKVTTEATCTTAGVKTFTCALCGATKTETISALGHIDENQDDKCDRCGEDLSIPDAADYVLASELKDGDEVIIVNVDVSKAMSEDAVATKYRAGVDVTPENDTITTNDSKIVWDVVAVDGGFQFRNDNGETLSATSGLSFASTDNVWALTAGTAENTFIISSTTATGSSGDPKSIEWFATYNEFSTYYKNNDNENLFAVKLYVKGGEPACKHVWDNGEVTTEPWCTVAGEKTFTCELCGDTKTESIAALGHIDEDNNKKCDRCQANLAAGDYSIAESVAAGDKIIIVAEFEGKYYAAANDSKTINNALNAIEVDVNDKGLVLPNGADIVWEVCAGSEDGKFTLKSSNGKYITAVADGTKVSLTDAGSDFTITCGARTSEINSGYTTQQGFRCLRFRYPTSGTTMGPQFRNYAPNSAADYSSIITIWKAN